MWKGLQNGWIPPDTITEKEYYYIKDHKDENPVLTGFVGFGCSFGGRFFQGYARDIRNRNYCKAAKTSSLRKIKGLQNTKFTCLDYRCVEIPKNSIVYCDPPYENTKPYIDLEKFNTNEFWEYMRKISKTNTVFISSQEAPDDFECIWQQEIARTLDVNKNNNFKVREKLFKYKEKEK